MTALPESFRWGAATASYQIEGGTHLDGRGTSIWDTFAATPGKVVNMEDGSVACDHYHRYPEDIKLMKDLGIETYRFSFAWPRLFPTGDSRREQRGFDFYKRVINELLENDIEPCATLYHWDLPQTLEDKGGWANRDIVGAFADYAGVMAQEFGDTIKTWATLNEPWCTSWLGYGIGVHAPGVRNLDSAISAAHHTALAHAEGTRAMRAVRDDLKVGLVLNMSNYRVDDASNQDLVDLVDLLDANINRWWTDAMTTGHYPAALDPYYKQTLDRIVLPGDDALLKIDTDFIGINYYSDSFVGTPRPEDKPMSEGGLHPFPQRSNGTPPEPLTDMGWPITPEGLHDLVLRVAHDWPSITELMITENGAAYPEEPNEFGEVEDTRRVEYITSHLEALSRAIAEGAPVTRYYAWSLLDNYEWAEGYAKRFGLIHVDFETQVRTPKRSAKVYATIIESNGEILKAVTV
jgi:beta-glucosidase